MPSTPRSPTYITDCNDFVSHRDALAKELRSSGDRELASAVKALRKPSRTAWPLNLVVVEKPTAMEALVAAISEAVAAQSSGADVRASVANMRSATRAFATEAASIAGNAGVHVDVGVLVAALSAVVGSTESFEQLRRGCLAEVPAAGGLDISSELAANLAGREPVFSAARVCETRIRCCRESAARRGSSCGTGRCGEGRIRSHICTRTRLQSREALRDADARVSSAETRLRQAEKEARDVRNKRDRAQKEVDAAGTALDSAQAALETVERRLGSVE